MLIVNATIIVVGWGRESGRKLWRVDMVPGVGEPYLYFSIKDYQSMAALIENYEFIKVVRWRVSLVHALW